ncbi:aldolase/citrate lyase family protein [Gordonia jinhuaensis]|uniref:Aldolase n=1 Tax=Gordonia jinhuaensis TaxID=1517702 RepID=A0A916T5V1_9ACTN|nr:aldolase/citrate lyase family protein [Gordonia jinhuaensis]GGB32878.1 aldolase [Gordonia jinhuaensis]
MTASGSGLSAPARERIEALLSEVDERLAVRYPGDRPQPQPSHTVYIPADKVSTETPSLWGTAALELTDRAAETIADLDSMGVADRVRTRLRSRPIDDLRIDLEDGYGWRADEVEDADARRAGEILAAWSQASRGDAAADGSADQDGVGAPWSFGVRAKSMGAGDRRRGIRTLEHVLDAAGGVPEGFVFTVPKLRAIEQVEAVVAMCEDFELVHGIAPGTLQFELQIESPQAVIGADGSATLARAIGVGMPRLTGLHYGTYDYSAACGIVSSQQSLEHPVADHAKAVMLAAAAQTGVWVSDGSTQVIPVGTDEVVDAAMRRHHRLVTRSLTRGYYQGWDMHPGHLVTRWLAVFDFFAAAMPAAVARLQDYFARQSGEVMDEPATAQSLALVVLRGLAAGAFDESDVTALGEQCSAARLTQLRASGGVLS